MGPVTPPARKRKDVVHQARPGDRWCSRTREEARRNRKGCLFGDTFIPFAAPKKDLFFEHIKPLYDPDCVSKYIECAKSGQITKPTGSTEETMQQPSIIEHTLVSLLDHNLSEYCNKVSRSLATSQKAAIDWIWRTTKFRTENEVVVHRIWKARALLFGQLEDHARNNPQDSPCNLKFTPEIVHLISGFVPQAGTPHARAVTARIGTEAHVGTANEAASTPLSKKPSASRGEIVPLADNYSNTGANICSDTLMDSRPANASTAAQESLMINKAAEMQQLSIPSIFSKPPTTQFYRHWTVEDKAPKGVTEPYRREIPDTPRPRIIKFLTSPRTVWRLPRLESQVERRSPWSSKEP
jgi:hypothetical protein